MSKVALHELPYFVRNVLSVLMLADAKNISTIVALKGELGAGKTTFVQGLAKELGVKEAVQSPTYVLMKRYPTTNSKFKTLVHIDAYRLESPEEFSALRPEEFLNNPQALVVVEWPKRLGDRLPTPDLTLNFSAGDTRGDERYIDVV